MALKTSNYGAVTTGHDDAYEKVDVVDDESSQPVFRDVPFSIAFFVHLGVMVGIGVKYGSFGMQTPRSVGQDETTDIDDFEIGEELVDLYASRVLLQLVLPCAVIAFMLGLISTAFVIPACPKQVVTASLLGSVAWTLLIAISIFASASSIFEYLGAAFLVGITIYYVVSVWKLIPFAAANLGFALQGLTANWGIYLVAILFSAIGFCWTTFWFYVAIGVTNSGSDSSQPKGHTQKHDGYYEDDEDEGTRGFVVFLLLVSLYWTSSVIMNTVQVTVAGVIGTYCFDKEEARSCCSPAVLSSLYRSVTYAFGSICFGSLLQALVTALRIMVENARNQSRRENDGGLGTILLCILECIVQMLEDVIEYFNQWAYVFVGIYGYSYLESGRRVVELFRARGWTAIVTNNLVVWVLNFTVFSISVVTGFLAMAIEKDDADGSSFFFGSLPGPKYWSFGIGFIVGVIVSTVMMSVARGAVNTLIVCFADAPAKLEENHSAETQKMAEAWVSVFPECGVRPTYDVVV